MPNANIFIHISEHDKKAQGVINIILSRTPDGRDRKAHPVAVECTANHYHGSG